MLPIWFSRFYTPAMRFEHASCEVAQELVTAKGTNQWSKCNGFDDKDSLCIYAMSEAAMRCTRARLESALNVSAAAS